MSDERRHAFPVSPVMLDIHRERERQITKGFNAAHDDIHDDGSIIVCVRKLLQAFGNATDNERWTTTTAKRLYHTHSQRESLVIAGAMIVAEIERRDRHEKRQQS